MIWNKKGLSVYHLYVSSMMCLLASQERERDASERSSFKCLANKFELDSEGLFLRKEMVKKYILTKSIFGPSSIF